MTLIAIVVLVVCVAFKVYVIHNCPSHPLYRRSALFTVESEKIPCRHDWHARMPPPPSARETPAPDAVNASHAEEIVALTNAAQGNALEVVKANEVVVAIRTRLWEVLDRRDLDGDRSLLGMVNLLIAQRDEARENRRGEFDNAEALREQLAAVQQERDEKAAMHSELATLAGSAIVLATLDTLAGERPTQEPEHALPAAVWRLVQERDEARAANTANLREMVGMAGRFRQTLQTVRACIVALTPGHRTGYDWNADPLYLTRKEGEALSAIDAALSSPSTQEPNKETKMSSEPEIARCGLCGEPMPAGEEMFKYHGRRVARPGPDRRRYVRATRYAFLHDISMGTLRKWVAANLVEWYQVGQVLRIRNRPPRSQAPAPVTDTNQRT